jgi:hypothetical protein
MVTLLSISFWLNFFYFYIAVFIANFIPGDVVLKKIKLSIFQRLVLGISIGMVLWAWQGILFGYLNLRWLSYIYLLVFIFIWLKYSLKKTLQEIRVYKKKIKVDSLLILLIVLGVLIQISVVWTNGIYTKNGLFFCCGNTFDNLLQISITDQIVKQIPPFEPGMYGTYIHNYHYWGNLVLAELIRIFKLPLIATQFQYATILISLLLGLNGVVVGQLLGLRRSFSRWLVFFLYFGGDLIFLLTFFLGKGINFSMSSLEDGSKFLTNYPRAFSIVLFFAGFNLLIIWLRKKDKYSGLLMATIMGSLIGFKVYTGIFALVGLGALALYYCLSKKFKYAAFMLPAFLLSLIVYIPVNSGAGGLYFIYLWLFENFASQRALGLNNLILAHYIYLSHNNIPRIILDEIFFVLIYIFAIFGTKLVALLQNKRSLFLLGKEINIFLLSGILVSTIGGFFFQQYSGGSNTFNFTVSVFIISSIYCALALYYFFNKITNKHLKYLLIILVISLTIPRVMNEIRLNISRLIRSDGFLIINEELAGLEKLKQISDKNSLILIDHGVFVVDRESAYISFLTDRHMFLSGQGDELNAHAINFKEQQLAEDIVLKHPLPIPIGKTLQKNKINYILTDPLHYLGSTYSAHFVKNIYQNKKIKILQFSNTDFQKYLKITE